MRPIKNAFGVYKLPGWSSDLENWLKFESSDVQMMVRRWLMRTGSMTQHLRCIAKDALKVSVICQNWCPPLSGEKEILCLPEETSTLIREVVLSDGDVPYMYARSVFPKAALTGEGEAVLTLGDTPLGTLLFKDPALMRSAFLYARLSELHDEYSMIVSRLAALEAVSALWARRSIFSWFSQPVLLTEVFLPELLKQK